MRPIDERPAPVVVDSVVELLTRTYRAWRNDRVIRLGAGLAYYALFAIVPLLVILIGLAGLAFSQAAVQDAIATGLADLMDLDPTTVDDAVGNAIQDTTPSSGLGIVGLGSLLFAASLLFVALQDAIDVIWHTPVVTGIEHTVRRRATAFGVILLIAALLVVFVAAQSALGALDALLPSGQAVVGAVARTMALILSLLLGATLVSVMLRILPHGAVSWRAAVIGGSVTTAALAAGSGLFGLYLATVGVRSAEGVAAGVFILLLWFYTMSQIVLAGAVLTRQIDQRPPRIGTNTRLDDPA